MALSYSAFFALYAISMVVAVFLGLLYFIGWKDMYWRTALRSVRYNAVYVLIIAAFPLIVQAQDVVEKQFEADNQNEVVYTNWIFDLAGSLIRQLQYNLNYDVVIDAFIIVYAWLFAFITYFVPIFLLVRDDRATLRVYATAMMLNYLVLTPFYLIFPVSVTCSHPEAWAKPFLYQDRLWGQMVTGVDPLNNDFPSGHVSLSVTPFLIFAYAGIPYRKLTYFLGVATLAIVFSVLFLGVHWPADVFAGFILGVMAVVAARNEKVQMTVDRYVRAISKRLFKDKSQGDPSSKHGLR